MSFGIMYTPSTQMLTVINPTGANVNIDFLEDGSTTWVSVYANVNSGDHSLSSLSKKKGKVKGVGLPGTMGFAELYINGI